ncbi:MAG: M3 family oligoendopeptidase [Lachnospiraceae bacterium]|nr:M3 family oligoendopeptidase [Lachnospiraceae bacterium]
MYDKWSLEVLYSGFDDEKFHRDIAKADEMIKEYQAFAETLGQKEERETVKQALLMDEEFELLVDRLYSYCSLRQSVDTSDTESVSYIGRLMQKLGDVTKASAMIEKYIAGVDNLDAVIGDDELLLAYSDRLHRIQKNARYMLSEDVEEALARMDVSGGSAWSDLQGFLTSSVEVDYNGEKTTLSGIRNKAYDADAAVRKEAYEAELKAYEKIKDSIAYSLNSIKMQDITESKMRGYASPLDKVLYRSRMERETLEALLEAMREYMPNFHSYLRAKAEALGHKNGLPWYDLFAPMGKNTKKYTVEESKAYLMKVFEKFNPHMAEIIDRAYEENWIDFFPRNGKVGGAFCASLNGQKQFRVLTNFDGSFSDVVTLAHELGHGYHDFMIFENRPLNTGYSMPVAETASTFNENVVTNYAIDHASSDDEKLSLLEGQLSDVTQIICDIYSRFLFESRVVENRGQNFMFADELCNIMLEAQKEAYGDGLDHAVLHPYMWACKSHYYSAGLGFYNFPYAFGGLFARGLYEKYKQEGPAFLEKYNLMLKETPVRSVEDVAKLCDIDLTKKEFWLMSLHSYDEAIAEFKRLAKK